MSWTPPGPRRKLVLDLGGLAGTDEASCNDNFDLRRDELLGNAGLIGAPRGEQVWRILNVFSGRLRVEDAANDLLI